MSFTVPNSANTQSVTLAANDMNLDRYIQYPCVIKLTKKTAVSMNGMTKVMVGGQGYYSNGYMASTSYSGVTAMHVTDSNPYYTIDQTVTVPTLVGSYISCNCEGQSLNLIPVNLAVTSSTPRLEVQFNFS